MRPAELAPYRSQGGPFRWLLGGVWAVERSFNRTRAQARPVDDTRLRIFFVLAIFALAFVSLCFEATRAALFAHPGDAGWVAPVPAEARSDLVDRNGRLLAADLTHYGVYIDPSEIWDTNETRRALSGAVPKLSIQRLNRALAGKRRAYLIGGLTPEEKTRVHDLGLPGISYEEEPRRVYPLGPTGAHLIGFSDAGGKGIAGAERALDKDVHEGAKAGEPVPLSIDLRVQSVLQDEVEKAAAKFGTVSAMGIVVDIHTGEILAMTSWPDFDPNAIGKTPVGNLTNHEMASVYELGSVFKAFTLATALDSGIATLDTTFDVHAPLMMGGHLIHDFDKGDSTLALWQVFTHSSNIGAAKTALMAGPQRMEKYFRSYGLFAKAPSEMMETARPILPRRMSSETLAQIAFGQGISVSPYALATGYTSLMNGGEYIPLTIHKSKPGELPKGRRVISEQTSYTMLQLMRLNVTDPKGSGHKADAPGLRVGGKTGSAQKPENGHYGHNNVSSFVGVFPANGAISAPRYLVVVTLDSPHATKDTYGFITAGFNAAPTVGAVIDRIGPMLGVKREATEPFAPPTPQAPIKPAGPGANIND